MSKKEKLELQFAYLGRVQNWYFSMMLALLTGMAALVYAVVGGEKGVVVLWLLLVGILALGIVGFKIRKVEHEIKQIIDEMEELSMEILAVVAAFVMVAVLVFVVQPWKDEFSHKKGSA